MAEGTKVKLQKPRAVSLGKTEIQWALASEGAGRRFEPVESWAGKDWGAIRKSPEERLNYGRLGVLFSDGGPGANLSMLKVEYQ